MGDGRGNYGTPAQGHPGKHVVESQAEEDSIGQMNQYAVNREARVRITSKVNGGPSDPRQKNPAMEAEPTKEVGQQQTTKNNLLGEGTKDHQKNPRLPRISQIEI